MDTFYTGCLWLSAVSFASAGVLVWAVPTRFKDLSHPNRRLMRRRQGFYSAFSFVVSAFCVFYALTQYPNLNRPVSQVVEVGLRTCFAESVVLA